MKKEYPVIDVPSQGERSWLFGARTLCFVYSKYNGNFILRGYVGEVATYLKKNYTHYFCYFSLWSDKKSRGYWRFWKNEIGIFSPSRFRGKYENKYTIRKYHNSYEEFKDDGIMFTFKRLPKRWINKFDQF